MAEDVTLIDNSIDEADSRNERIEKLRDFRQMAGECLETAKHSETIQPEQVSKLLSLGEEFGIVSREGMAKGLHYPYREKQYLNHNKPLDQENAVPVLTHVMKQATRALNIERRGGHLPREQKPLYGDNGIHAEKLRYK